MFRWILLYFIPLYLLALLLKGVDWFGFLKMRLIVQKKIVLGTVVELACLFAGFLGGTVLSYILLHTNIHTCFALALFPPLFAGGVFALLFFCELRLSGISSTYGIFLRSMLTNILLSLVLIVVHYVGTVLTLDWNLVSFSSSTYTLICYIVPPVELLACFIAKLIVSVVQKKQRDISRGQLNFLGEGIEVAK